MVFVFLSVRFINHHSLPFVAAVINILKYSKLNEVSDNKLDLVGIFYF